MTKSMTAFSRRSIQCEWGTAVWELRSVNHRYLDICARVPDSFRDLETILRELCKKYVGRGKIDCLLRIDISQNNGEITTNGAVIEQCILRCEELASQIKNPAKISPLDILKWPGVIEDVKKDHSTLNIALVALFEEALIELVENRHREGVQLQLLIEQRLKGVSDELAEVRQKFPIFLAARKQKMVHKFNEISLEIDQGRLEQELVIIAQKSDVEEELDRLDAHLTEIHLTFKRQEPIGRRLDFLMQELTREANTLGSKSIATDITQSSIELKVLIEQMREQIQNIE
jgi:uncharacterized protein (TIGR00255 family)